MGDDNRFIPGEQYEKPTKKSPAEISKSLPRVAIDRGATAHLRIPTSK